MKRLFTRCLLVTLLAWMGFTTGWAQKSVLDESFASGDVPKGWNTVNDDWCFSKKEAGAQWCGLFANEADTLASPVLSLSDMYKPSVAITYSLVANNGKVDELKVLYRASLSDDWSVWKTFKEAKSETVKDVLPDGLANVQIAIACAYKGGAETWVKHLAVENKTEAADAPTGLKTEDLTTTSVTLWWDVCTSPLFKQYNIKVNSSKMTDMSATADVVDKVGWLITDEFYELSGLTPNREYWFYVQYDCGDGDVSPWAELSFTTPCSSISAPFAENFEEVLSDCYTIAKDGTAEVSGEYAHNSTKAFKFVGAKGKDNYLIFPEFSGEVKGQQISFWAAAQESGNTYARTITVGVCTDPTDLSTFTEVTTLDLPKGRQWEFITVSLAGYTGAGKYIALRAGNADKENRIFVDDIQIEAKSACPKPMFVSVSEITPDGAKFAWVEAGNANEWNLVISTKPLANPESFEPDAAKGEFAGAISTNPYTVTGLKANTTYFAYLQPACGASEWTEAIEFKTSKPVSFPYSEHFDHMDPDMYTNSYLATPNGWVVDVRNAHVGGSYFDQVPSISSDTTFRPRVMKTQNHETTAYVNAALQIKGQSDGSSSTNANVGIAIMPAMPEGVTIKDLMVSFWALSTNGAQTVAVGVAKTQTNDLPKGKQLGDNITLVNTASISSANEWKKCKVLLKDYTGDGRYIVFSVVPPELATPTIFIDDIEIDYAPDCNSVTDLAANATGVSKATVSWTDASSSASWVVKVSSTEIDPESANGDIVAAETVNAKSYDITGLSMGQTYYIYVSPTCGDAWTSTTVTTPVGLQVPYYNDFTSENTGANATRGPKNWTLGLTNTPSPSATSTYWPYVYATAWSNPPADVVKNSLRLYNYATTATSTNSFPYAIMPELLNADVKDLKMSFYAYADNTTTTTNYAAKANQYYGVFKIGVVNKPSDINKTDQFNKVTNVATIRCSKGKVAERFIVDFSSYAGSDKYIVFYMDTAKYNYMYIDNLSISLATDPQAVSDITTSEISQTGAKLTWKENGVATKWEVRVFDAAQEDPAAGTPIWSNNNLTAKEATITSLNHSTQYFAYVRSLQDNGNGAWGSLAFYSECGAWAIPFYEDWNNYPTGGTSDKTMHPCYNVEHSSASNWPYVRLYTGAGAYHPSKSNFLNMQATGAGKVGQIEFPKLNAPINTLQMEMEACSQYSNIGDQSITYFGVVTSDGTFHKVAERQLSAAKTWENWVVDFSTYTGEEGVIAIRQDYDATGKKKSLYICIENVKISVIPQCKQIQPDDIEFTEVGPDSATITWPVAEASKWNLKVSTSVLENPDAATADIFDGEMTTNSKKLTDIADNTVYYVYVQTVRPEKSCVGDWSRAANFKTTCFPRQFPYEENFDSYTTTGAGNLPDCSNICGEDAEHSYISTKNSSKCLYVNQKAKTHKNYFVFPALNSDDVRKLQLSMQVYVGTTATTKYHYQVGIMTDPYDPSTFVALHTEELLGSSTAYDRVYKFDEYQGDETGTKFGGYVAITPQDYVLANGNTNYTTLYIDNVVIDLIPTCAAPIDLQADSIGSYGAKFIWNTDDKTAAHRVRLFTSADADPNSDAFAAEAVANDSVVVVNGLSANTIYYAFVRKECALDDVSKWSSVLQLHTECAPFQTIPYAEGFEGGTAGQAPDCWKSLLLSGSSSAAAKVVVNSTTTTYAFEGEKAMSVNYYYSYNGSSATTGQAAAVTPKLDIASPKDLLIYFDVNSGSATHNQIRLEVAAASDNTTEAEIIPIITIEDITTTWKKAYIKVADYYTSAQPYQYIRFTPKTNASNSGATVYIDNIVFTKDINTILPVGGMEPKKVDLDSLTFAFVESTPGIEAWKVAYVVAGGDIADATIIDVNTTTVTLTGLTANTSYDIYVRSVEGTEWSDALTMTTASLPASLPYEYGFEDAEENANMWKLVKTNGAATYHNYFIFGDASKADATGTTALFVTNNGNDYAYDIKDAADNVCTSYSWAMRNIRIENAGTYKFSFKVKNPGNKDNENDCIYAHLLPVGTTCSASNIKLLNGTTRNYSATTDANNCYSLLGKITKQNDWITITSSKDIMEPGIYTIAIVWMNSGVGTPNAPAAIDSVKAEEYLCTVPRDFEYTKRSASEVSIKWFAGQCKNFEYVLARYAKLGNPAAIDAADKIASGTLTEGPEITLSNLLPYTNYSFYVRTACPDGLTDWVEYDFKTPCELYELPYTEGFFETPECWIITGATVTTGNAGTSASYEKWSYFKMNNGAFAILPELNVPLNKIQVEVGVFNTSTTMGEIQLGAMDNTYDKESFKQLATFAPKEKPGKTGTYNEWVLEPMVKMLNLYQGSGKVLALKNTSGNVVGVKYITLTELADCVQPQQIELTYINENGATVNWIAGIEDKWEIQLNDSVIKNVTTNPYVLTNLEQGTTYTVAVRALCDTEHTSEWSQSVSFITTCGVNQLPMNEDFSGLIKDKQANLRCWEMKLSNLPIQNVTPQSFITAPKSLSSSYTWTANWLSALGETAQLSSWDYKNDYSYKEYMYRWFISPQYAIEGDALLSFDARMCNNEGGKALKQQGRFFVAISTDNGASWQKEDQYNLTDKLDSVYQTQNISLEKYANKTIRIAFYHEGLSTGLGKNSTYVLIDNVRMNCTQTYPYEATACKTYDYEGYGFKIAKTDIPAAGKDSVYKRFAKNTEAGCDSIITLKLTTHEAKEANVEETICQGEEFVFGPYTLTEPSPAGTPYYITGTSAAGCDSTIYLTLHVNPSDTIDADAPITVTVNELPKQIDEYLTIPAGEAVGQKLFVAKMDACHFKRYDVTIKDAATGIINITADVASIDVYDALGRKVQSFIPSVGQTKLDLPSGMYMVRKTMTDGQIENIKLYIR